MPQATSKALQAHQGGPAGLEEPRHSVESQDLGLRPLLPGSVPGVVYEEGLRLEGAGAGRVRVHADLVQQGEQNLPEAQMREGGKEGGGGGGGGEWQ